MGKEKRGRNWTVEERRILFNGIRDGKNLDEVNAEVAAYQAKNNLTDRQMPASSFLDVKYRYIPSAKDDADYEDMICNPRRWVDLSKD